MNNNNFKVVSLLNAKENPKCPTCNGTGKIYVYTKNHQTAIKICVRCGGSGL